MGLENMCIAKCFGGENQFLTLTHCLRVLTEREVMTQQVKHHPRCRLTTTNYGGQLRKPLHTSSRQPALSPFLILEIRSNHFNKTYKFHAAPSAQTNLCLHKSSSSGSFSFSALLIRSHKSAQLNQPLNPSCRIVKKKQIKKQTQVIFIQNRL